MIEELSLEDLLRELEKLHIIGRLVYEDEAMYTTHNLTSQEDKNYTIPYHARVPEIIISRVILLNGEVDTSVLDSNSLIDLREGIKSSVVHKLFELIYASRMLPYLLRLQELLKNHLCKTVFQADNSLALMSIGYHPDIIDYRIEEYQAHISKEIVKHLTAPLSEWLQSVLVIVQSTNANQPLRRALIQFSKITPNNSEPRISTINPRFTLINDSYGDHLREIFEFLIQHNFIDKESDYASFHNAFLPQNNPSGKVSWRKIGQLQHFIRLMIDEETPFIVNSKTKWETTALHFAVENKENIVSKLADNKRTIKTRKIERLAKKLRDITSLYIKIS